MVPHARTGQKLVGITISYGIATLFVINWIIVYIHNSKSVKTFATAAFLADTTMTRKIY